MSNRTIEKLSKLKKYIYSPKDKRLLILFGICLAIIAYIKRPWFYNLTLESGHYIAYSTATKEQSEQMLNIAEILYKSYTQKFEDICNSEKDHPKLKLKIYKNRKEFKSYNMLSGWAEAFYRKPYCQQYYDDTTPNPYHWMIHEATHQLNQEIAGLKLEKWLDEGIASYFSTSKIEENQLKLGFIDHNTYPIWWLSEFQMSGNMQADIDSKKFIPLSCIILNKGGPNINKYFNTYYIHWWSLVHFLYHYEDGMYSSKINNLMREGGTLKSFETNIGPVDKIQQQWYEYLYNGSYKNVKQIERDLL